jgi:hypothetical protein
LLLGDAILSQPEEADSKNCHSEGAKRLKNPRAREALLKCGDSRFKSTGKIENLRCAQHDKAEGTSYIPREQMKSR